jgi:hypothetical protein
MAKRVYREVRRQLTARDYKILNFLWRWKVVSSQALARKFFPGIQNCSAHLRLRQLEEVGYLVTLPVAKKRYAWGLGKKGYDSIWERLATEVHDGYKPDYPHHDFVATAFHLGEWLTSLPEGADVFSEQELRCIPDDLWPEWIPQSVAHRPDGYSRYTQGEKQALAAFEVEMTLKSKSRYEARVYFYENQPTIERVFWLVGTKGMAESIRRVFERYNAKHFSKHNFILLSDFHNTGWDTKIFQGRLEGKTLIELLGRADVTMPPLWHHPRSTLSFLDTRVSPIQSKTCEPVVNSEISNRVP